MFGVAGGIAYATIPDANGVYTACKLNATGTIRLIDLSLGDGSLLGHCTSLETQITWNQRGQQGPAGPPGAAGPQGLNGDTGAQGQTGPAGPAGPKGDTGDQGPKGDTGDSGPAGPKGTDGVDVTAAAEAPDPNCAAGGAKLTAANGVSYVCKGENGVSGYQLAYGNIATLSSSSTFGASSTATCPVGKTAISGGWLWVTLPTPDFKVSNCNPASQSAWVVALYPTAGSPTGAQFEFRAIAVCVSS